MHAAPTRSSLIARLVAAASVLVGLVAVPVLPATAADDPPPIRWAVTPADENGPDGRTAVENTLDPGATVSDHLAVRNVSDQTVTFRLAAADGFYTRNGRFDMLSADKESVDSGTWITLPDEVTVAAGSVAVVPFELTVPERAEPGDHAAGITASVLSTQSSEDGTSVGVESRVGFRVLTRVTGEIVGAASVQNVSPGYETSWNPFRAGVLTVTFEVVNDGNTRLLAEGTVEAGGQTVAFPAAGGVPQELLPGDVREIVVVVPDVWPLVAVPTHVNVQPTMITMDGASTPVAPVSADAVAWAIPWPQLLVLAGVALVVGAIVWGRIRSRRRLAALLESAREEGRVAAAAGAGADDPMSDDPTPGDPTPDDVVADSAASGPPTSTRGST